MSEHNYIRPTGLVLLSIQASALVTIMCFSWYLSGLGFEALKPIGLTAAFIGFSSAILGSKKDLNHVDPELREKALDRSMAQSRAGIPLYAAPVVWVPVVMLVTIWCFA